MVTYKRLLQDFYYDLLRRKVNSSYRAFLRVFVNARNRLIFREYGKHVHWDPGVIFESPYNISIGDRCRIKKGVEMYAKPWGDDRDKITLRIGNRVSINSGTFINAHDYIEIGNGTLIGKNVLMADTGHDFKDPSVPVRENPIIIEGPIIIGEGCYIGFNTFIQPGVSIGKHVQIGTNSIITRDIPPYSVAAGNPARVLRRYDFEKREWIKHGSQSD
ncbi:MAG: hypothetical protein DRG37_00970 [Deltaproteobacteria bacterium]|nr:MAG: hypothetical protein DRG37_00970 [Deltaproteobacteria bacterium]